MTYRINTHRMRESAMVIAIEPQGAIDSAEAAELLRSRFRLVMVATHPERIVLDLSAVPSISDEGVDAVRSGCHTAAGGDASVEVVNPAPKVLDQLSSRGLTGPMDVSSRV